MSKNKDILNKVEELLKPIAKECFIDIWDIDFVKEGKNLYLRIYIDKESGVSIDDCEIVSKSLENKLDEEDFISQSYILEVSSPGINRALKKDYHFYKFIGEIVDIKLYKAIDKKREFQGELISLENNIITICDKNKNEIKFDRKEVASCKLAILF